VRADLHTLLIPSCPASTQPAQLRHTTPLPCGQSVATANRSELAPCCGFGYCAAHSRFYWWMRLVLWCGPDGCVCDFDLVPANAPEREGRARAARAATTRRPTRERLRRRRLRTSRPRARRAPASPQPSRRAAAAEPADREDPAADRVDRQLAQRPTPARTPPREDPSRPRLPHRRPHPRAQRRHPPQLATRPTTPRSHRLRASTDQASRWMRVGPDAGAGANHGHHLRMFSRIVGVAKALAGFAGVRNVEAQHNVLPVRLNRRESEGGVAVIQAGERAN
jgi:hypothetical protein